MPDRVWRGGGESSPALRGAWRFKLSELRQILGAGLRRKGREREKAAKAAFSFWGVRLRAFVLEVFLPSASAPECRQGIAKKLLRLNRAARNEPCKILVNWGPERGLAPCGPSPSVYNLSNALETAQVDLSAADHGGLWSGAVAGGRIALPLDQSRQ